MSNKSLIQLTAILLVIEGFAFFIPVVILGAAINWPASLGEPANVNLPLILEQMSGVRSGYFFYLLYSVLVLPLSIMLAKVADNGKQSNTALQVSVGFGIASAVLRVLGIIRWFSPMFALATTYTDPATSMATRESISVTYEMLNNYAGSVGEVLGVGLFASLWIATLSLGIWQTGSLPRWFAAYGYLVAVWLGMSILDIWGVDIGIIIPVSVSMLQIWFLLLGGLLFSRSGFLRKNQPIPAI